jgi:hypothetical protein
MMFHFAMEARMRYLLLWLLGVPIPVLILIYFLFR